MGDFVNYTPGEYAKEHIRITPTTLADGRDFFYLDDDPEYVSGVKTRELKDPRQLPYRFSNQLNAAGEEVPYAAPEMRRDPLTGDWIPMATARMNRPITAGPGATAKGNPLAARKPGDPYQDGEVPDTDYNVVVFENRFPSMVRVPGRSEAVEYVNGNPLWEKKLAAGRCEVICFDPDEDGLPADLPVSRLRTVVEAWAFRTAEISKMEGIEQIFPFENHGQEIGVSLAHPHGQVYCYPFIAPKMEKELQHTEAYHEKTGGNLLKDIMNAELEAGERIVMRNHSWVAYVPAAARWPLEVHVAPVRDVLTLDQLNDEERWDLASMYSHLLKRGNASSTRATARAWTCRTSQHGIRPRSTTSAAKTTASTCSSSRSAAPPTKSSIWPAPNQAWPHGCPTPRRNSSPSASTSSDRSISKAESQ